MTIEDYLPPYKAGLIDGFMKPMPFPFPLVTTLPSIVVPLSARANNGYLVTSYDLRNDQWTEMRPMSGSQIDDMWRAMQRDDRAERVLSELKTRRRIEAQVLPEFRAALDMAKQLLRSTVRDQKLDADEVSRFMDRVSRLPVYDKAFKRVNTR